MSRLRDDLGLGSVTCVYCGREVSVRRVRTVPPGARPGQTRAFVCLDCRPDEASEEEDDE